jgi:GNAT superfamily N-acetyltransferase
VTAPQPDVRPLTPAERSQLRELLTQAWGDARIVSRGRVHDAAEAAALGAFRDGRMVGLATYITAGDEREVLTLNAFRRRQGVGSSLLKAVTEAARASGCRRLWLITTNDNADAIRFYEASGMRLVSVHKGAADEARRLKPSIPEFAPDGTRISDELEFEFELAD